MSKQSDDTMVGPKVTIPVGGGHKVQVGLQGANLITLLALLAGAFSWGNSFIARVDQANAAVQLLGERMDKVDSAIAKLAENDDEIEDLKDEVKALRATDAQVRLETAAALACAKDKRRC